MSRLLHAPCAPAIVAAGALAAAVARWVIQGSGNVWTSLHQTFVLPDPDVGWRPSVQHPIWLGLDSCALIAAIAIALTAGAWWVRRREAARHARATILRAASWVLGVLPLAVPIAAFASGPGPAHGLDSIPPSPTAAIADGIAASLDAPAGVYALVPNDGNAIVAHVSAGGDAFDVRFSGDLRARWQGNPKDLAAPMAATVSVDASSVDTGVAERSKHAREEYLHTDTFPRIALAIDRVLGTRADAAGGVAFRAHGRLELIGRSHDLELTGTIRRADAAALARLGLTGDVLLVQAELALPIRQTALGDDARDFDGDHFPIHASLVLRRTDDGSD